MEAKRRKLDEVLPLFGCGVVMALYVLLAGSLLRDALAVVALLPR